MAITIVEDYNSGATPPTASSAVTGSVTGTNGDLFILVVSTGRFGTTTVIPTISADGAGRVWTQIITDWNTDGGLGATRVTFFRAVSNGSAGTITISTGAESPNINSSVLRFTGVDTTTNQGVVQSASPGSNPRGNVTTVPMTLSALSNSANMVVAAMQSPANSSTNWAPAGGYTELYERHTNASFFDHDLAVHYAINGSTNPSPTYGGAATAIEAAAIEIMALLPMPFSMEQIDMGAGLSRY